MSDTRPNIPAQSLQVFQAQQFCVVDGANLGDPVSIAEEVMLDDTYALGSDAALGRLAVNALHENQFQIDESSQLGKPGHLIHLDCTLTLMSPDGQTTDALILVEATKAGKIADVFLLPMAPILAGTNYAVVGLDITSAKTKFAQLACVSFTRGTHITLASGEQRAIQDLNVGDRVLTRDDGAQKIRWIGHSTVRAVGAFAPIRILAGTLHNDRDLLVSQNHRLFIYQRRDSLGAGRAELLVKARHLVNGTTIHVQTGGFVDYFQLLFDRHQIIYAEGIAAESLLIDQRTRPALPKDVTEKMGAAIPGHTDQPHRGLDVDKGLLDRPDVADVLRRSSST
jgi:hypothetical protein